MTTKDLKYQMVRRHTKKFTECFVGPYRVKAIISSNAIELELPSMIKIHPVINVSRVWRYKLQVEGQKKEMPQPVVIKGEEEWEVEKIMNKKKIQVSNVMEEMHGWGKPMGEQGKFEKCNEISRRLWERISQRGRRKSKITRGKRRQENF